MGAINKDVHLFLLTAERLLRCRWDGRSQSTEILNSAIDGETIREIERDPVNPNKLYAATLTEIHASEDGGASWQWLPSGGIEHRDIWSMAVHPTRGDALRRHLARRCLRQPKRRPVFSRAVVVPQAARLF